jgi:hypothetical protein
MPIWVPASGPLVIPAIMRYLEYAGEMRSNRLNLGLCTLEIFFWICWSDIL